MKRAAHPAGGELEWSVTVAGTAEIGAIAIGRIGDEIDAPAKY